MIFFSEDGNQVIIECAACGTGCNTLKFQYEAWDDPDTWGFIILYGGWRRKQSIWHRIKDAWCILRGRELWPEALEVAWRTEHVDGIRRLGQWLIGKSAKVGYLTGGSA